jgi:hypothetical protein
VSDKEPPKVIILRIVFIDDLLIILIVRYKVRQVPFIPAVFTSACARYIIICEAAAADLASH